jgi:hypothetical protein
LYEPNNLTMTQTIQVNLLTAQPVAKQKQNIAVLSECMHLCAYESSLETEHISLTQQTVSRAHDFFENFKLISPN